MSGAKSYCLNTGRRASDNCSEWRVPWPNNNCSRGRHGVSGLSAWADGPDMITQCPIRTGHSYTYELNITKREGTLFWHAHEGWRRATVFGAIIIRPRAGHTYPFPKPYREVPILRVVEYEYHFCQR